MQPDSDLASKIFGLCKYVFGNEPGTYIEAGANDGVTYSNTIRLQLELNWDGILVEPGIPAYEALKINRPGNLNLNLALVASSQDHSVSGTFTSGSLLSSAHPELRYRDIAKLNHKFRGVARLRALLHFKPAVILVDIQGTTIDKVIEISGKDTINLLSLDIEGMEADALRGMAMHRPKLVVIETRKHNIWEVCELMIHKGYALVGDLTSIPEGDNSLDHRDLLWVTKENPTLIVKTVESVRILQSLL